MNASRKEDEGDNLLAEAEKKVAARSGFFKSLMGLSSSNKEEAAEMFVKAANCFKLAKAWTKAGTALERAAETYADISEMQYEAASKYSEAGKAYKNVDIKKATHAYENAVNLYSDAARFQQCARLKKEVAEILESENQNAAALDAYNAAADFYDMDDAKSNANSMRIKAASLNALEGKFAESADMFESIAQNALGSNMLKYGAREHLLKAGLCRLCISDVIGAQRAVESYDSMDPTFATSREGKLLQAVVKAVDEGDVDAFTNHVFEYDSLSKLDEWKTTILLKIKNNIKADEDDLT
ncbi:Alpha-soluble NSF attachment protein [Gracilariopsis chorda]|uniref:Alpha-soluble NSF attachment protein n=1 Tax=Gracilariopsis chorda TaxID=448386 RepID=A0A2V3IPC8_9FLOR|nr:Alpha-soluble NSF attachment protein [Gracilariopsis chorda]|eukprot:PXF43913.1 Alpha-soluble NSF attachment protein [Gracilariopsis chorda]